MSGACAAAAAGEGYLSSVSRFIDCRAELLDTSAFATLAAPGSTLSLILTGFLTIFVALIGYNLLLGRGFDIRSGTVAVVKIGAVLTLVTSWPAYQILIYNVVVDAPAQLVAEIGRPIVLPGSDGTLLQRLDATDSALQQVAILGPGPVDYAQAQTLPPPPMANFDAFALGGSRILFLISSLSAIIGARMVAALMLAVGPYFIALILFENTRSWFEGWVRVLAGAALASIAIFLALGFELAMLEPWLADVLARRTGGEPLPTMPTELFVITSFFGLVVVACALAAIRLAAAFRLARPRAFMEASPTQPALGAAARLAHDRRIEKTAEQPSRAALTAGVLAAMERREAAGRIPSADVRLVPRALGHMRSEQAANSYGQGLPIGRAFPRRAQPRATASARRRDNAS